MKEFIVIKPKKGRKILRDKIIWLSYASLDDDLGYFILAAWTWQNNFSVTYLLRLHRLLGDPWNISNIWMDDSTVLFFTNFCLYSLLSIE